METVQVVGAAVVDDLAAPTQLLAARRTGPPRLAGRWELPGGKVDPGETPEEALHRELVEELGVQVELGPRLAGPLTLRRASGPGAGPQRREHAVPGESGGWWPLGPGLAIAVWWACVTSGVPTPLEDHDELRWLTAGRWHDVDWLDGDVAIVRALEADRPGAG